LLHVIRRSPSQYGFDEARWTLERILRACHNWLRLGSLPGLCQLMRRLGIHWKRARQHVHSPDAAYVDKLRSIKMNLLHLPRDQQVMVFQDEFTLTRQPSLAQAYEQRGAAQPLAELGYFRNYTWRIAAALQPWTGQVTYQQAWVMDVTRMLTFYRKLVNTYPGHEILLVQDNWSVHYHPDLLAALQPQELIYGNHAPPNWSRNPKRKVEQLHLPIRLLFLPTYASWTNPIEKLWRLLHQEVLHLHRYQDDWPALKQRVWQFLDQFEAGSPDLLKYVGLQDPHRLYQSLFPAGSL
jgi:hypothetical protein